jgi:hypothetical protein
MSKKRTRLSLRATVLLQSTAFKQSTLARDRFLPGRMNKHIKTSSAIHFARRFDRRVVNHRDSREAALAIADMLQSGRVILGTRRRSRRRHGGSYSALLALRRA